MQLTDVGQVMPNMLALLQLPSNICERHKTINAAYPSLSYSKTTPVLGVRMVTESACKGWHGEKTMCFFPNKEMEKIMLNDASGKSIRGYKCRRSGCDKICCAFKSAWHKSVGVGYWHISCLILLVSLINCIGQTQEVKELKITAWWWTSDI